MNENPENVIGVTEIAQRMNVDRRTVQRMAKTLPGRLPPHRSHGRGHWFDRPAMMKWIGHNKAPEVDRHRPGRKRKAAPPQAGQQWREAAAAVPVVPYNLFRSTRRAGCAEFAAKLSKLAEALGPLPDVVVQLAPKIRLQGEHDQIWLALRKIRDAGQNAVSRYMRAMRAK